MPTLPNVVVDIALFVPIVFLRAEVDIVECGRDEFRFLSRFILKQLFPIVVKGLPGTAFGLYGGFDLQVVESLK